MNLIFPFVNGGTFEITLTSLKNARLSNFIKNLLIAKIVKIKKATSDLSKKLIVLLKTKP